jgi:phytoene synthase
MDAIYAFMRHTDDLGDSGGPIAERREAVARWRHAVIEALSGDEAAAPSTQYSILSTQYSAPALLPALADVCRRFCIPAEHFLAVIEGVEMDLEGRCYRTFDELTEYCDRVASAVGLVCIHVWGFRGEGALGPTRRCGLAFQLTNILRDLKEDAARGRIYLPLEDLNRCGYSPDDLARGVADERFERLMAIQIDRARGLYREGAELFDWLEPPGRRIFGMMVATYYRLLETIARQPRRVLEGRVRLSPLERLRIAARWMLLPARRAALP